MVKKTYTPETMEEAEKLILSGKHSWNAIVRMTGIREETLRYHFGDDAVRQLKKQKTYRDKNIDKERERCREYYKKNKERILKRRKEQRESGKK